MSTPAPENPYRQPASPVVEQLDAGGRLLPAGKWRRFFNWLIDKLMIVGLVLVVVFALMVVGPDSVASRLEAITWWQDQLITIAALLLYYTVMEGLFGVTVGKWITRTRVVDERGLPPGLATAFLRSLARLIPFDAFSVLFSEDGDPSAWHDRLPRTRVVMRDAGPPPLPRSPVARVDA